MYDGTGNLVACLGCAGPSFRITSNNQEQMGKWTKELAEQLSAELSGQAGTRW